MGSHHRRTDPGSASERPAFDEVAHGYDPRQVDDYLATLWRYASQVTSRAAAAESALKAERERSAAVAADEQLAAQAGGRIGQMLAIAHQEAEEIISGARAIAESALEEAIEDGGANHPIVREARDQAEKLLLDAVEESRRIAAARHLELQKEIARSAASLDSLRHQQGEIIGAVLRLRSFLGSDEVDRAVTDLARAGSTPPPAGGDSAGGDSGGGDSGGASLSGMAGVEGTDGVGGAPPGAAAPGSPPAGPGGGATGFTTGATPPPGDGPTQPAAPPGTPPPAGGWAPTDTAASTPAPDGSATYTPGEAYGGGYGPNGGYGPTSGQGFADGQGSIGAHATAGAYGTGGAYSATDTYGSADGYRFDDPAVGGQGPSGLYGTEGADGVSGYESAATAAAARAFGTSGASSGTGIGSSAAGGSPLGFGRRPPGRHRQGADSDAESSYVPPPRTSVRTADAPFRSGADEDIIDAEIVEE